MTVTWVSVTSGKASTDRFLKAITPAMTNSTVPSTTNKGMFRALRIKRFMARFFRGRACLPGLHEQT